MLSTFLGTGSMCFTEGKGFTVLQGECRASGTMEPGGTEGMGDKNIEEENKADVRGDSEILTLLTEIYERLHTTTTHETH